MFSITQKVMLNLYLKILDDKLNVLDFLHGIHAHFNLISLYSSFHVNTFKPTFSNIQTNKSYSKFYSKSWSGGFSDQDYLKTVLGLS